jgi:hypothetical protein
MSIDLTVLAKAGLAVVVLLCGIAVVALGLALVNEEAYWAHKRSRRFSPFLAALIFVTIGLGFVTIGLGIYGLIKGDLP